jgi:hypothetical protein
MRHIGGMSLSSVTVPAHHAAKSAHQMAHTRTAARGHETGAQVSVRTAEDANFKVMSAANDMLGTLMDMKV